jgi:hypothetical protein
MTPLLHAAALTLAGLLAAAAVIRFMPRCPAPSRAGWAVVTLCLVFLSVLLEFS